MNLVEKILKEAIITPPQIPNTMNFWHGGNLEDNQDVVAHKGGRWEYGAGLYLTTSFTGVQKYAKGSRKLYMVTVEKGTEINSVYLPINVIQPFIRKYVLKHKVSEVLQRLEKHKKEDNSVRASIFNNILINEQALKPANTAHLRQFLINNGIDYELVHNYFGEGDTMMVLYNMKKIKNIIRVTAKDTIEKYDLH
jgi:hypothetical protein